MTDATPDDPIWQTSGPRKRQAVREMFGEIAPTYDRMNALMSLAMHRRWRATAVRRLRLRPGDRALDVCCGTGDFLLPLRSAVGSGGRVVGLDFCLPMLRLARSKAPGAGLLAGDACRLPVASGAFDGVTVGWGIRNVADIDAAHREIARVLRPGGRFVSLDMAQPRSAPIRHLSALVARGVLPRLGKLVGAEEAYRYLPESTERFWSRERLSDSMRRAGFALVGARDFMFGNICMHWGEKA